MTGDDPFAPPSRAAALGSPSPRASPSGGQRLPDRRRAAHARPRRPELGHLSTSWSGGSPSWGTRSRTTSSPSSPTNSSTTWAWCRSWLRAPARGAPRRRHHFIGSLLREAEATTTSPEQSCCATASRENVVAALKSVPRAFGAGARPTSSGRPSSALAPLRDHPVPMGRHRSHPGLADRVPGPRPPRCAGDGGSARESVRGGWPCSRGTSAPALARLSARGVLAVAVRAEVGREGSVQPRRVAAPQSPQVQPKTASPKPRCATAGRRAWGLRRPRVEAIEERPFPVQVDGDYMREYDRVERDQPKRVAGGGIAVALLEPITPASVQSTRSGNR